MGSASEVAVLSELHALESDARKPSHKEHALVCPKCGDKTLHRAERKGFMQKFVYPRFGLFPWKCRRCQIVKLYKKRGIRRHRTSNA